MRIKPNELHISHPTAYNTIYLRSNPLYEKYYPFYRIFLAETASIGIMDGKVHGVRRGLLNGLFNRNSVIEMESTITTVTNNLCAQIRTFLPYSGDSSRAGKKLGLTLLFKLVTGDVISAFCYGKSFDTVSVMKTEPDTLGTEKVLAPRFIKALASATTTFWFFQRFWRLQRVLVKLPDWMVDFFHVEVSLGMRDIYKVRFLYPHGILHIYVNVPGLIHLRGY